VVALGTCVQQRKQTITIADDEPYKRCRVQLHAQGIVLRDVVPGRDIKTKTQQLCRANDFLVAEIDAKVGGFGVVPANLDGAIVSSHYFLFDVDSSRLIPEYLAYCIKTRTFQDQVTAQGSTNYAAIRPAHVSSYRIPLPSIEEQRHVVGLLDAADSRVHQVRRLSSEMNRELDALCRSMLFSESEAELTEMGQLVQLRPADVTVERQERYAFAGVYCFGRGVFRGQTKSGMEFAYDRLTRLRAGDFTYPKLMAWEGAMGMVPTECDGLVVSPEYPVFTVDTSKVLPEVVDLYFRAPSIRPMLAEASTGTNVRRRRLHPSAFLRLKMPVPPMAAQCRIRDVMRQRDRIAAIRRQSSAEISALFSATLNRILGD
jgi:type I restriction enzyme S subunit